MKRFLKLPDSPHSLLDRDGFRKFADLLKFVDANNDMPFLLLGNALGKTEYFFWRIILGRDSKRK